MNQSPPNDPQPDEQAEPGADSADGKPQGTGPKSRPTFNGTSESTRGMRDTSRRRRDAEEKLQQHLMEAKDHVPYHHDQEHGTSEEGHNAGTDDQAEPGQTEPGQTEPGGEETHQ